LKRLEILIKTKGGHKEGMGDVTSCLALAEEFGNEGCDVLLIINDNENVIKLISKYKLEYRIAKEILELEQCINGELFDITILNQLNTPKDESLILRRHSKLLVTIDDTGQSAEFADLRFNVLYPIADSFTDFKYIALTSTFQQKYNISKVVKEKVKTILITQGGGDTYGYTPKIIRSLYDIPNNININVVIGTNYYHYKELDEVLHLAPRNFNIIKENSDLSGLMLQADLAISAGGNTLFELACIGVPTIVVCGERFEVGTAERMQKEGFGKNLGFGEDVDEMEIGGAVNHLRSDFKIRAMMVRKGKQLIDGQGTKRVVEKIIRSFYRTCNV
tara:strand:- start:115 stop:1113 length:999 start_codon:yes stop_codon:yes gene_type:complete